ncbi:MAG: WbqC family protein, partial [Bacteroidales bacterium]|nr:WbqC family protein [Bacteroidales bacterium]
YPETRSIGKAERLIAICKKNNIRNYINAAGGKELYTKDQFLEHNISLHFIKNHWRKYSQFGDDFIPNLSIIDVMMFNSPEEVRGMMNDYELE